MLKRISGRRETNFGRLPSLGHDYDAGHRSYVDALPEGHRLWLRTKPFSAPPSEELAPALHTFAHVVERLRLGLRAQVLDVGCGPGWLSEFLARCGYWVTGIDVSEDMVEIARERIAAIESPISESVEPLAEFHAMPVRELPWVERFDAAILYDTMHHFDEELETLRAIQRSLVPGGQIYIREGARPEPGSEAERNLIAEMERHGTLESPFDPAYLVTIVREAGFERVKRLIEVDELVDVDDARGALRWLSRFASYRRGHGDVNTIVARKPLPPAREGAAAFAATVERAGGGAEALRVADTIELPLRVTNTGRAFWPAGESFPFPQGTVTVGPYLRDREGGRIELERALLPHAVRPGESVEVQVRVPKRDVTGAPELLVDLVYEGVAWFSDLGSQPLVVPLQD
jgi:SAM-dependent methyltransferase